MPMAFEYLEVRPCIEDCDGEVESFINEVEYEAHRALMGDEDRTYWTIYGRYSDEAGQFLAMAIGDFTEKNDAFAVMNAILAPMAKARDKIRDGVDKERDNGLTITAAERAACDLEDFINQSSNHERL